MSKCNNDKRLTLDILRESVIDTGITIEDVIRFITMNGTVYRKEILKAMEMTQPEEMLEIDNDIFEEDKELWETLADM